MKHCVLQITMITTEVTIKDHYRIVAIDLVSDQSRTMKTNQHVKQLDGSFVSQSQVL